MFNSMAVLKTEFQQAESIKPLMYVQLVGIIIFKDLLFILHQFLESAKFSGHPAVLHLVIVAATTPTEDDNGVLFPGNGYSPWLFLAQKLAKVISLSRRHGKFFTGDSPLLERHTLPYCRESSK